jgi:hypothetical protein
MSDTVNLFEEFLQGARGPAARPLVRKTEAEREAEALASSILSWSIAFRFGTESERLQALRGLCGALRPSLSLTTVLKWFGDPWHRPGPRLCPATNLRREVLSWRHPVDERAQLQMLFHDGSFVRAQVVIDGGASLPPRILPLERYWRDWDVESLAAAGRRDEAAEQAQPVSAPELRS